MKRSRCSRSRSPFRKHSEQRSRSRSCDFYSERSHDHRDSREYRPRDSPKRSLYRSRSRERAYRSRTPSERGDHAERYGKGATSLLGRKKKRSDVSAVRQMFQSVMSGFQKSLEAFGNSSSAGASSRGTPSPREERPAKSVSSSHQGGASSSRARASSFREEREREERSRRSTRRPDRSSGDRGQLPPRKRRRSRSPSVLSFSGSDNVSLHPSDSLSNEVDGGSEMHAPTLPASVTPAPLEIAHLSLGLRLRLRRMRPLGSGVLASVVTRVHSLPLLERRRMSAQVPPNLPSWRRTLLSARF